MASSDAEFTGWIGTGAVLTFSVFSLIVSLYHGWVHDAPRLPEILGQWSLFVLSVGFGLTGYYVLAGVETSSERAIVGLRAGIGYVLAGLAAGLYGSHQHLTPEAALGVDAILFQATFVANVGGIAGIAVGLETVRRERTVAELDEATGELEATQADTRTEKRRFESLFQNSPTAIADLQYTSDEPTVDRANAAFEDLLGQASTDVEGENLFDAVPLRETATEEEVASHVEANEIYEGEVTVDDGDDPGHYKLRVIPYDVDKIGDRAFAIYTDVTELRETQRELEESVERLEGSNERLEQFAYAISHDLQEPLRMVSSYLQLLEDRYADELDEDAREFIDFAVDGAERMRAMIDSLLEYSRVTTRGEPMEPTDAEAVLDDVLTDLRPRIQETDASITADDLPTVVVDPDQLAQVFRNLVSNAIDYAGDGPPRVHVGVDRVDEGWRFAVDDQGIGIDPEQHDRIFEVFESAHTAQEGSGTGLGLAICQRIVDRHGGEMWVESDTGEGATFYFTIPQAGAERTATDTRPPSSGEQASGRNT